MIAAVMTAVKTVKIIVKMPYPLVSRPLPGHEHLPDLTVKIRESEFSRILFSTLDPIEWYSMH